MSPADQGVRPTYTETMGATKVLLTAEQFDNYPFEEDKRYELDEGELIEITRPAYLHNRVLLRLTNKLFNYFEANPHGEVLNSENLYALSAPPEGPPTLPSSLATIAKNY